MAKFTMEILPPILEGSYPAFNLSDDFTFAASLSAVNTMLHVDHAQIKIFSLNTNKNALNEIKVPKKVYFVDLKGKDRPDITIQTILDGVSIFSTESGMDAYGSYYRMQIRFGLSESKGGTFIYNPADGQNPPDGWDSPDTVSEWSNSSVIKSALTPAVGIIGLESSVVNDIYNPTVPWFGYYETDDTNEALEWYQFALYDRTFGLMLEESEKVYIKEYEIPTLKYKFKNILESGKDYRILLRVCSATGLITEVSYDVSPFYPNVKLFTIAKVVENEDEAVNEIVIDAKQIILKESSPIPDSCWKQDQAAFDYGDELYTHLMLDGFTIETPSNFAVPYSDFVLQLTTTNFQSKIKSRLKEALENPLIKIGTAVGYGTTYEISVHRELTKAIFTLSEKLYNNGVAVITNLYKLEFPYTDATTKEFYFLIKKEGGETTFEAKPWLVNNFKNLEV